MTTPSRDKINRIDFFPHDWLLDTAAMDPAMRGVFIQICALIWARGECKKDYKFLTQICGGHIKSIKYLVDKLVDEKWISETPDGYLVQKRAVIELEKAQERVKKWSENGRKGGEQKAKNNKINDESMGSPDNTTPNQTKPKEYKPPIVPHDDDTHGVGVFKNLGEGGVLYRVESHLDDDALQRARRAAPGWDIYQLMRVYDEGINSGKRPKPIKASAAFPVWCAGYVKDIKP